MAVFLFNAPFQASAQQRVYLDESGTLGYSGELFTMALVLVRDLPKLETSTLKHRVTQSEVKASQMKTAQKLALARTLLEENDIEVFLARLDPLAAMVCERKLDKEFLYDSMVAQALAHYLELGLLRRGVPYRISMDMRGGLRESYEDMVGESVGNVLMHRAEPLVTGLDVRFLDSRYSAGVQAADLFSNVYRTALTQSDSPCTNFLRKFEADGRVHTGFTFGLPELADQMTQIAADLRARVELERTTESGGAPASAPAFPGGSPVPAATLEPADANPSGMSAGTNPDAAADTGAAAEGSSEAAYAEEAKTGHTGGGTSRSARRRRSRAARKEHEAAEQHEGERADEDHENLQDDGMPADAEGAAAGTEPAAAEPPATLQEAVVGDTPADPAPKRSRGGRGRGRGRSATAKEDADAGVDRVQTTDLSRGDQAFDTSYARKDASAAETAGGAGDKDPSPVETPVAMQGTATAVDEPEAPTPVRLPFAPARDMRPGRSVRMRQSLAAQKRAAKLSARRQQQASADAGAPEAQPAGQVAAPAEAYATDPAEKPAGADRPTETQAPATGRGTAANANVPETHSASRTGRPTPQDSAEPAVDQAVPVPATTSAEGDSAAGKQSQTPAKTRSRRRSSKKAAATEQALAESAGAATPADAPAGPAAAGVDATDAATGKNAKTAAAASDEPAGPPADHETPEGSPETVDAPAPKPTRPSTRSRSAAKKAAKPSADQKSGIGVAQERPGAAQRQGQSHEQAQGGETPRPNPSSGPSSESTDPPAAVAAPKAPARRGRRKAAARPAAPEAAPEEKPVSFAIGQQ